MEKTKDTILFIGLFLIIPFFLYNLFTLGLTNSYLDNHRDAIKSVYELEKKIDEKDSALKECRAENDAIENVLRETTKELRGLRSRFE